MIRLSLVPVMVALLAGCAGETWGAGDPEHDAGDHTTAIVIVERTSSANDGTAGVTSGASARFVRYPSNVPRNEALRRVGAVIDLPALGTCAALSALPPAVRTSSVSAGAAFQLVDVGAVTVSVNGVGAPLQARYLPDLTDLAFGVIYSRVTDLDAPPGALYDVTVGGVGAAAAAGGGFTLSAKAPNEIEELSAFGAPVSRAEPLVPPSHGALPLRWKAGVPGDVIYLDLRPAAAEGIGASSVRCSFADVGVAMIPSSALAFDEGTLTIHRLHQEGVAAALVDSGEIRFDFATTVPILRK